MLPDLQALSPTSKPKGRGRGKPAGERAPKREKKESGGTPKKKGGKKKNPWSDSESDEQSAVLSDDDMDTSLNVSPRERAGPRRQAGEYARCRNRRCRSRRPMLRFFVKIVYRNTIRPPLDKIKCLSIQVFTLSGLS